MKAAEKERRRLEAERKNAPISVLIMINNMALQMIYGLEGGKEIQGVKIPAIEDIPVKHRKKCSEHLARIVRWNAECLEREVSPSERTYRMACGIPAWKRSN